MDPQRFDQMTRQVGTQTDRRHIVKTVASGALALLGVGVLQHRTRAASGKDGDTCSTNADCETGLICQGASRGLLGGIVAEGPYGPPYAADLLGPSDGTCRYRDGNCAKSGQYCSKNSDCCNGSNLECRGHKCKRRN